MGPDTAATRLGRAPTPRLLLTFLTVGHTVDAGEREGVGVSWELCGGPGALPLGLGLRL